ncbi:MAG: hypothetical protein GAK28_04085 [Luteibacter sp.]|uniref:CPBP family intramembrane glutamic endopeptidase n=1 Tax=Luteibacter sp. TaxID=1886636 RepID=UPI00137EAC93|nr:type II CAAX endopeptidase family protein [Luteibacter sp.]KAF1004224.1 MAG: hypothetical protein GAK28_04085 [Luteibacter sp.]
MNPSAPPRPDRLARIVRSPLGRIVIFFITTALIGLASGRVYSALGLPHGQLAFRDVTPLIAFFRLFPAVLAYWLLVRFIESRKVSELAPRKAVPHLLMGMAGGVAVFSLIVGALWALGAYRVDGVNHNLDWLGPILVMGVGAGVGEEIISCGIVFRIVEEGLGTWAALLVSAALFGGLHLANPNATTWVAVAIAIEAGLLIGLLFHLTRSLWACIGAHAAWNLTQGLVYGIPVSGFEQRGLLASHMEGPNWVTGGAFGVEASVVSVGICSMVTALFLSLALRRGSLVPPPWRRSAPTA